MAFDPSMLSPIGASSRAGHAATVWAYTTTDNEAAVNAAGYFASQRFAMRVGDFIIRTQLDGAGAHVETGLHVVTVKTAALVQCATAELVAGSSTGLPLTGGTLTGLLALTVDDIAAAGADQAGATELTAQRNRVSTCAAGAGVRLSSEAGVGVTQHIRNDTANDLKIYPPTGETLGDLSANAADTLPAGQTVEITKMGESAWRVF